MKLQKKLMVVPVFILTMQALSFGALLWVFQSYKTQSQARHEELLANFSSISEVHVKLAQQHAGLYRTVAISGSLDEKALKQLRDQRMQLLSSLSNSVDKQSQADSDEKIKKIARYFTDAALQYNKSADMAIDMSTIDPNTGIAAMQTADANFAEMDKTLSSIIALIKLDAAEDIKKFESSTEQQRLRVGMLALLSGILSIGFAWIIQRRVVSDLGVSAQATRAIASGHLNIKLESQRADELGDMVRSLGSMVKHLHGTIELVQQTASTIASESDEIAQDNKELKTRTEEQAISLEETADAMKKITGTVKQNADNAYQA
ncbi:MAG: HAMP domain-containing protein, partial [Pseudomonadota bacterium]